MGWLAIAVRRVLAVAGREKSDGPERTSNTDIRAELDRLATLTESAWQELFAYNQDIDRRLFTIAWRDWGGSEGNVAGPPDHSRYLAAVSELGWLAGFLRRATLKTESSKGPWRSMERKLLRIERGQYLALVFETAFGEPVSANNWPNDARFKTPTAFMDFYQRMVTLAFGSEEATNLAEVVKEACKRHRQSPAQFGDGVIDGS